MIISPRDLFVLKQAIWPHVSLWSKQVEVVRSVCRDGETHVPAANKVGKDFVGGFLVAGCATLCAAMGIQFKIVTTSATQEHLDNLWGEIDFFIRSAKVSLTTGSEGRLVYLPRGKEIGVVGQSERDGSFEQQMNSYVVARVIKNDHKGEGLSGHHAPWNLFIADECSGMADIAYKMAKGWAQRMLLIGNPWPTADNNFFERGVEAGDLVAS